MDPFTEKVRSLKLPPPQMAPTARQVEGGQGWGELVQVQGSEMAGDWLQFCM